MKNPDFAQIKLRIDNNEFHPASGQSPDHIIDMEITRVSESTLSETSITVYDDSAMIVESMLLGSGDHTIYLQYGWGNSLSKVYVRQVSKYELEFNSQGSTLTIESIPNSTEEVIDETPSAYTGSSFVDIVNQYCESKDIVIEGTIEESKALYKTDISTAEATTQYKKENETDEEFIRRMLSNCSPSSGGSYNIVMTDVSDEDGNVERHLKVTTTGGSNEATSESISKKFTYVIGKEHEEIISFTPENNVGLVAGITGSEIVASGVDPLTNDVQEVSTQIKDATTKVLRRVAGSCYTNNEMLSMQSALVSGMAEQQYTAELVLVGTIDIEPEDEIEMSVITKDGYEHHSSGVYTVKQVTDSISGGSFTTTILMCKGVPMDSDSYVNGGLATPSKYQFVENYAYSQQYGYSFIPEDAPNHNLLGHVQDLMGIKYLSGGKSVAKGLDAAGLMHHLIYNATHVNTPYSINELSKKGSAVASVSSNWKIGDLLFWSAPVVREDTSSVKVSGGINTTKDENSIWNYLYSALGNAYGVAGIMGNMAHESGLVACRMQGDFSRGYSTSRAYAKKVDSGQVSRRAFTRNGPNGGGWGLVQWTYYTLKERLYDYAKSTNQSIGSLKMQLEFLVKDLKKNSPAIWKKLKNAKSVRQAAVCFLLEFERPADQSTSAQNKRTASGQEIYNRHARSSGRAVTVESTSNTVAKYSTRSGGKTLIFGDSLANGLASTVGGATNGGVDGDSTAKALKRAGKYSGYSTIVISLGTNDTGISTSSFSSSYKSVISTLKKNNPGAKIICSASPGVVEGKTIYTNVKNSKVREINNSIKSIASSNSCKYMDLYGLLNDQKGNLGLKYRSTDGLHLNSTGYKKWWSNIDSSSPAGTKSSGYVHVACFLGNGYIFQTTSAYGHSHISKLSNADRACINTVRRFEGMYTCKPTEDGYKKQAVPTSNSASSVSEDMFRSFCNKYNLTEALNSSGIQREIAKFAVLACINEMPYYWGGGHAGLPVYPGWANNNFCKPTKPDKDGRKLVGCDCSGFTGWCYISAFKSLGISNNPPICHPTSNGKYYMDTVRGACAILKRVSTPAVGDYLAFANEGHTGIYMGNGMCIHSSYSKAKVVCIKASVVGFTKQYRL